MSPLLPNAAAEVSTLTDMLLTRDETAQKLTTAGYPVAASTLAAMAVRGGGPAYQLFGRRPLYRWGNTLAWAENRLGRPRRTTSKVNNQAA